MTNYGSRALVLRHSISLHITTVHSPP